MGGEEDTKSSAPLGGWAPEGCGVPGRVRFLQTRHLWHLCSLLLFSLPLNTRPMGQAGAEPTVLKAATRAGPVPKMLTISRGPRVQQVKTRRFQSLHNRVWKECPGSTNCLQAASELSQEDQPSPAPWADKWRAVFRDGGAAGMDKRTVPVGTNLGTKEVWCRVSCV